MDPKSDQGIFMGYSVNNTTCRMYNNFSNTIMESINVVIDDTPQTLMSDEEEDYVHINEQNRTIGVSNKHPDIFRIMKLKIHMKMKKRVQQTKVPLLESKRIILYKI